MRTTSNATNDSLREAGAILPGRPTKDRSVDAITARAYRHPALPDRVVVRLIPGTLGEAEDLSMEFLGFTPTGKPAAVGNGLRQALGFPAWALVNDPANGRHALALVKEMQRLARVAKTKPGNAKIGYDELAVRLGLAAPHFLPTFWEQAGRAFLAAENSKAAGTCFVAARLAEQVHGLPVDEERLRDVHLEFAFAGALTAKALGEYARQVAERRPAAEAYELVRAIAVRRVAGGLPPYVGMAEDLKRLVKAAGLKPDGEAESVIGELLGYPATAKAHEGFWKPYRTALVRLAKRDPATRGRLLALLPDPPGYDVDATEFWLELLDETGATLALRSPATAPAEAAPVGGVAAWVQRFLDHRYRSWRRRLRSPRWLALFGDIIDQVREELQADDAALRACPPHLSQTDLDTLDMCLALGVPVADPSEDAYAQFDLQHWSGGSTEGRTQLAAVAADERFLPSLVAGLRHLLGATDSDISHVRRRSAARHSTWQLDVAGLRTAAEVWLTELARQVGPAPTVLALADALDQVAPLWSGPGTSIAPEVFAQLADIDLAASFAKTLRGGFLAELVWPAYEEAYAALASPELTEAWPGLVLADRRRAIAIGPDGVLLDHTLRLPSGLPSWDKPHVSYVDGQFRVGWSDGCYWSGRPGEILMVDRARYGSGYDAAVSLALPEGGRTTGHRPWQVGDGVAPERTRIASDGLSYWRLERVESVHNGQRGYRDRWREYDPSTGAAGRVSQPAFLAAELADGDRAEPSWSSLHPAPEAYVDSVFGWRDGLVGWRAVRHCDGSLTGTGIDGRTVTWWPGEGGAAALLGAVRLPGDDRPLPVTGGSMIQYDHGRQVTLWDVDGRQPLDRECVGSRVPPANFWPALQPRDVPGSFALRAAGVGLATRLVEACSGVEPAELQNSARKAVAALLPEVTDDYLAVTLATAVNKAEQVRRLQVSLRELLTDTAVVGAVVQEPAPLRDDRLDEVLKDFVTRSYYHRGNSGPVSAQIEAVAAFLAGAPASDEAMPANSTWSQVLPWLGALVVRAASPVTSTAASAGLQGLLSAFGQLGFAGADKRVRVVEVTLPTDSSIKDTGGPVRRSATSTLVLLAAGVVGGKKPYWRGHGIEFSPTGEFDLPEPLNLSSATTFTGWGDPDRLAAAVGLLTERGPAPWHPDSVERLAAATGMTRAEAALLLAGLPGASSSEANFLDPAQRALLGVKAAEARIARDSLRTLTAANRLALLDAAMPEHPADLWEHGPDVMGLAQEWTELFGRVQSVSEELLAEAGRMLHASNASDVVRTIGSPQAHDWLHSDGMFDLQFYQARMTSTSGSAFGGEHLLAAAVALPWLAYRLRAGDPIRAQLAGTYQLVRQRLRHEHLRVGGGYLQPGSVPSGMNALTVSESHAAWLITCVSPVQLSGVDDPALAFIDDDTAGALRVLLSDRFAATMAALADDPTPSGRYPHDPMVSQPELVDAVAVRHQLAVDAAAYYLQLLALPDPTDRRVAEWNQWPAARLKAAKAALAATDLVVEAKRERAGRSLFLPGGWLPLKAPNLPVEAWKADLNIGARGEFPFRRVLVTTPVADLFRLAWDRVMAGDQPRYQSLSEAR